MMPDKGQAKGVCEMRLVAEIKKEIITEIWRTITEDVMTKILTCLGVKCNDDKLEIFFKQDFFKEKEKIE